MIRVYVNFVWFWGRDSCEAQNGYEREARGVESSECFRGLRAATSVCVCVCVCVSVFVCVCVSFTHMMVAASGSHATEPTSQTNTSHSYRGKGETLFVQ